MPATPDEDRLEEVQEEIDHARRQAVDDGTIKENTNPAEDLTDEPNPPM
jgi:hypothetical protein